MDLFMLVVVLGWYVLRCLLLLTAIYFMLSTARSLRRMAAAKEEQVLLLDNIVNNIAFMVDEYREFADGAEEFLGKLNKLFTPKKTSGDGTMEPEAPADRSGFMEER